MYDCILVRVSGEISLKSEQVKPRFVEKLAENISKALNKERVRHRVEIGESRIFVYPDDYKKAVKRLIRVFGISSVSPCRICHSSIEEMSSVACEMVKDILDESKSFAVRARKVGRHDFSLRAILEEVGARVKKETNASVNLTSPDVEIFIECRSRRTFIFLKKIRAVGGLPLGTGARANAVIRSARDLVAAWLVMRRGSALNVYTTHEMLGVVKKLKEWHVDQRMKIFVKDIGKSRYPIVSGELLRIEGSVVINPVVCLSERCIRKIYNKIIAN